MFLHVLQLGFGTVCVVFTHTRVRKITITHRGEQNILLRVNDKKIRNPFPRNALKRIQSVSRQL